MTILQLTSTATAFLSALLALVASSTAAPLEVRTTPVSNASCLLQRNVLLQVPNSTLTAQSERDFERSATATTSQTMSEAMGWLGDIFAEEFSPLFNGTTVKRVHLHGHWTPLDKAIFILITTALVLLDAVVLQRLTVSGLRQHLVLVCFWLLMGIGYNAMIFLRQGAVTGVQWCSGYILEWLLSLDNLFVFHLIFRIYDTPPEVIHKALFLGILGAIAFRFSLFALVRQLLDLVTWFRFFFGAFLIWSGIQAAKEEEEDSSVEETSQWLRWILGSRLLNGYEKDGGLIVWRDNKLTFTLMLPVVCCLETTDLIFAVDSVSAKAAQIPDFWTSATSSVLAMFGLRAMFFVIQDLVQLFGLLKYGLCFILMFIGVELMISDYVSLPPHVVCVVILSVFCISIAGSSMNQGTAGTPGAAGVLQAPKSPKASP